MIDKFFHALTDKLTGTRLIFVLAIVVGLLAGLAAVVLKYAVYAVHYTAEFLTSGLPVSEANWIIMLYPIVGLLLTVIYVKYVVKDSLAHGISTILYAISKRSSLLRNHNMHSSVVASSLTIGFGGSVGLEAPIVLTGSAFGSWLGRRFHLNYKTITLLVACGATGAVAGIFKAPIAGVLFAMEVLMLDLTMASLIPLMIAAITATSVAWLFMGDTVLFAYSLTDIFTVSELPAFVLLGFFTGLVSIYFSTGLRYVEGKMETIPSVWVRWLIGGVVLAILIVMFPPLYGEGYDALTKLLNGHASEIFAKSWWFDKIHYPWIFLVAIMGIILLKVVATAVTSGAGGVGGVFAPSLFLGGLSGFFLARLLNNFGMVNVSETHFTLVGMAGVMSGVMRSPLTAMFLIAEITGGYALIIPLMLTVAIAYLTAHVVEPHSVYTRRLAARGELITHNKDKAALTRMKIRGLIERDIQIVAPDQTLGELVQVVAMSNRNVFPVLDTNRMFLGLIIMERLRPVMFKTDQYQTTLCKDLMYTPEYIVEVTDSVEQIAQKIQASGKYILVVLDQGKYVGCVSRARVFSKYRELMKEMSED
jgi:chloride channel protein, CIC family